MTSSARQRRRRGAFLAVCLVLGFASLASASDAPSRGIERVDDPVRSNRAGDGVYGRFNGDISLQIGAGVEVAPHPDTVRALVFGDFSIYQTVGLYGSFRQTVTDHDPIPRLASLGIGVAPLFLFRWSRATQFGHAIPDLILDSLTISGGTYLGQLRDESFGDPFGFEGGLSIGIPLMARANGLWLRTRGNILTGGDEVQGTLWLMLTLQGFVHTGLLSADR